jgi:hypothetical protein
VLWFSALESQCRVVQHPPHLSSQVNAAPTTLGRISTDGVLGLNPSRGRQDQHIMRINLCGMERCTSLNYYGSIRSERAVTPRDENRCVMRLVCELREMWWLVCFMRNWLECYLGVYSRNLWSSIQIWLKILPVSNKKVLLTFDWSAMSEHILRCFGFDMA